MSFLRQNMLLLLFFTFIFASCTDKLSIDDNGKPLDFKSLTIADTVLEIDEFTSLTAIAEGEGLVYKWDCDYGSFIGSGHTVMWAVCHEDTFEIICTISDKFNNKQSKSVFCYVY